MILNLNCRKTVFMGKVRHESRDEIIKLMLQEKSTEEIAKITGYSIGTIRNVFEELREKYDVNSKLGITKEYIGDELEKIQAQILKIFFLIGRCQMTPWQKINKCNKKNRNFQKNKKFVF